MKPSWPTTIAYGIETCYCPVCMEPEPDGGPNEKVWEEFGKVCCDNCAEQYLADNDQMLLYILAVRTFSRLPVACPQTLCPTECIFGVGA